MATKAISDMLRQKESPTRSRRKVVRKDQLRHWRSLFNWVVYLKNLLRENLFHVNLENWAQNTPWNFQRHLTPNYNSGKKGSIARCYPKVNASWSQSLRAKIRRKSTWGDLDPRTMCQQSRVRFGETYSQAQEFGQSYVLNSNWGLGKRTNDSGAGTHHFDETRGARIRSRFRSIDAHDEQNRIKLTRDGHSKKSPEALQ